MKKLFSIGNGYCFPYNFWYFIKYFPSDVKCAYQRVTTGHSEDMFFSLDMSVTALIVAGAHSYQEHLYGYPQEIEDEFGEENAMEMWKAVMFLLEEGFSAYQEQMHTIDLFFDDRELYDEEMARLAQEYELAFYMLSVYYDKLWN